MKQPTKINFDLDDDGDTGGGDGGGGDGCGLPLTPGRRPRYYKPRLPCPAASPKKDSYDALMDRYNKLKNTKYYLPLHLVHCLVHWLMEC